MDQDTTLAGSTPIPIVDLPSEATSIAEAVGKYIALGHSDGNNTSKMLFDLIVSGLIKSIAFDSTSKKMTVTLADNAVISIDLSSLSDTYLAGAGLDKTNNVFSVPDGGIADAMLAERYARDPHDHNVELNNTVIGINSLSSVVSGKENTSIGSETLAKLDTGHSNTAVGSDAMTNNINSYSNTSLGVRSLYSIESGDNGGNNIAVGVDSMFKFKDGYYNVAMGDGAFRLLPLGNYNIAIGYETGNFVSIGGVGGVADNLTSCVIIGDRARVYTVGASNEIVIGSRAIGSGSNTVTLGNNSVTLVKTAGDYHGDGFIKEGSDDTHVLTGGGGHVAISALTPAVDYMPISGGTFEGDVAMADGLSLTAPVINLGGGYDRNLKHGIGFYLPESISWQIYTASSAMDGVGVTGTLYPSDGNIVDKIAMRFNVDSGVPGNGFIWESIDPIINPSTPNVVAELGAGEEGFIAKKLSVYNGTNEQIMMADGSLIDYYHVSFVPNFIGMTTAGVASYSTRLAEIIVVGKLATIFVNLIGSFTTAPTGQLRISGLPITVAYSTTTNGGFAPAGSSIRCVTDRTKAVEPNVYGFGSVLPLLCMNASTGASSILDYSSLKSGAFTISFSAQFYIID